jgi:hypothetical protein
MEKGLAGAVIFYELWRLSVALQLLVVPGGVYKRSINPFTNPFPSTVTHIRDNMKQERGVSFKTIINGSGKPLTISYRPFCWRHRVGECEIRFKDQGTAISCNRPEWAGWGGVEGSPRAEVWRRCRKRAWIATRCLSYCHLVVASLSCTQNCRKSRSRNGCAYRSWEVLPQTEGPQTSCNLYRQRPSVRPIPFLIGKPGKEKSCSALRDIPRKFVNFAAKWMGSSRSQFISPLFPA